MAKYTREEALEAASRLTSLYGVYTTVCDCESYSFVGIHLTKEDVCICAIDEEVDIEALRKFAQIIVQADADLRQEDPNLDSTYANTMLQEDNRMFRGERCTGCNKIYCTCNE